VAEDPNNPFWFPQFSGHYEPIITPGTILQYWRGDKTWQTLDTSVVPENTNLYFTNARAISSTLTGYVSGAGTITAADTILQAIQKLNGNISTGYVPYTGATSNVDLGAFNLITPKVIGGSAVGSQLALQGTSGNGTSTVAAINFLVGNNGATTAGSVYNSGNWNIGVAAANPAPTLGLVRIGQGTSIIDIGMVAASASAIWFQRATPTTNNYAIYGDAATTIVNGSDNVILHASAVERLRISRAQTSGTTSTLIFTGPSDTGMTASSEIPKVLFTLGSRQWATGAITTQREVYITSPTYSFVGASTITSAYTLYVARPTASTNATITNNYSIGTDGNIEVGGGNIYMGSGNGSIYTPTGQFSFVMYGGTRYLLGINICQITPGASGSGANTTFSVTNPAHVGQTASAEIPGFRYIGGSRQWNTGAITTQRETYFSSTTYTAVGASVISTAYGMYVEAPTASTNVTINSNYALGVDGNIHMTNGNRSIISSNALTLQASSGSNLVLNGGSGTACVISMQSQGTPRFVLTTGTTTSGAVSFLTATPANFTGQTASTEINGYLYNSYTRTWAAGAITTQREHYLKTVTYAFASASTITSAYGLYVEAPTVGTNATITNNYALGVSGGAAFIDGTTIRIGQGSGQNGISFSGSLSLTDFALWGTGTNTVLNTPQTLTLRVANSAQLTINSTSISYTGGASTSGAISAWTYTVGSNTNQTASTEIPGFNYSAYSRQWATGAITTQREIYHRTVTYTAVGASVITSAYGMFIEAPTASTNITITNNFALGLTGNLQLQTTTSSTTGVIFKGTTRFLHNYNPSGSSGRNLFLGMGAGNFTATWASGSDSTANTGIGELALQNLTNGSFNNCIGGQSGQNITSGFYNNLQGYYTGGELSTGIANTCIGESALRFGDGSYNTSIGYRALFGTTGNSYSYNVAIGYATGYNLTTGSNNIFIGASTTTGGITSGAQNILIGYQISPQSVTANGQLSIGNLIFGQGISATGTTVSTGTVGIGIVASTTSVLSLPAATGTKSQIKLTLGGTLLVTPEAGTLEAINSHIYWTDSTGARWQLDQQASAPAYIAKTANYTATNLDTTIDCTANSFTVTLPTAVGISGKVYNVINSGAGTITLATTSSQVIGNISPTTTITINPGEVVNVQSDGANWKLYA
jgi:hypothetical protein